MSQGCEQQPAQAQRLLCNWQSQPEHQESRRLGMFTDDALGIEDLPGRVRQVRQGSYLISADNRQSTHCRNAAISDTPELKLPFSSAVSPSSHAARSCRMLLGSTSPTPAHGSKKDAQPGDAAHHQLVPVQAEPEFFARGVRTVVERSMCSVIPGAINRRPEVVRTGWVLKFGRLLRFVTGSSQVTVERTGEKFFSDHGFHGRASHPYFPPPGGALPNKSRAPPPPADR